MKLAGVLAPVTVAGALLGIAFACGPNSIQIATLADAGRIPCEVVDGGDGGGNCLAGQFCSRMPCSASAGTCETIVSDNCAASGPECGCDGISYSNSCGRQFAKISLAGQGQCSPQMNVTPKECSLSSPISSCPRGTNCASIFSLLPLIPAEDDGGRITSLLPPIPGEDGGGRITEAQCVDGVHNFEQTLPLLDIGLCWSVPDCSLPDSRRLQGICDQGKCIDDCTAISAGGVYILCPTLDASTSP